MGAMLDKDVIITTDMNDMESFRWLMLFKDKLPDSIRHCLVGPVSMHNGRYRWFFSASGSNKGWPVNEKHGQFCDKLLERFQSSAVMVVQSELDAPYVVLQGIARGMTG